MANLRKEVPQSDWMKNPLASGSSGDPPLDYDEYCHKLGIYALPRLMRKELKDMQFDMIARKLCTLLFTAFCQVSELMNRANLVEGYLHGDAPESVKKEWEEERKLLSKRLDKFRKKKLKHKALEEEEAEFRKKKLKHDKEVAKLALKVNSLEQKLKEKSEALIIAEKKLQLKDDELQIAKQELSSVPKKIITAKKEVLQKFLDSTSFGIVVVVKVAPLFQFTVYNIVNVIASHYLFSPFEFYIYKPVTEELTSMENFS